MIRHMDGSLYFLLAVGLSILLTAVFRRLRADDGRIAPLEDDVAFERRMEEIERRFDTDNSRKRQYGKPLGSREEIESGPQEGQ